jgi:hypothetical protein
MEKYATLLNGSCVGNVRIKGVKWFKSASVIEDKLTVH